MQFAYTGETVYIYCQSFQLPRFTKDGVPIKSKHILQESKLTIFNVQPRDNGKYKCEGYFRLAKETFVQTSVLYVGCEYVG